MNHHKIQLHSLLDVEENLFEELKDKNRSSNNIEANLKIVSNYLLIPGVTFFSQYSDILD